ncbi:MAG: DUF2586 family protein [Deltaproteobacteria bacterium]|nr:DUF2586 family protein [Myxococcales bacterium]MDP3220927.1 DUF2586 family protein [Deltaproteobacteria bacterium]
MTLSRLSATIADGGLGNVQTLDLPPCVVGCSSAGTAATPTRVANPTALIAAFGYGPMVEAAATLLDLAGGPIVVCKTVSQTAGALTGLTSGETAAPTPSGATPMTCAVTGTPLDKYDVKVKVIRAGATLQALTASVRISLDGGTTYGPETPVPSSGALVIANTGITITFDDDSDSLQLYADNVYSFGSTAPAFDATGLAAALTACEAAADTLDHEYVHVVGPINATTFATVVASATRLRAASNLRWFLTEARDQNSGESVATWVGVLEGTDPGFAGLTDTLVTVCPAYATQASRVMPATWRRPLAWLLSPRFATIPVQQHPGRVRTGAIAGIVTLHHDFNDAALQTLDAQRFLGAQTIRGRVGFFATDRTCAATGSDYTSIMRVRVICYAARVAIAAAGVFLNEDNDTGENGTLATRDADAFDASVDSVLQRELIDQKITSTASARVSRSEDVLASETLPFVLRFRPRNYAKNITLNLGYTRE